MVRYDEKDATVSYLPGQATLAKILERYNATPFTVSQAEPVVSIPRVGELPVLQDHVHVLHLGRRPVRQEAHGPRAVARRVGLERGGHVHARPARAARHRAGAVVVLDAALALAAARALIDMEGLDAEAVARKAMAIAADICVYTNEALVVEKLPE